MTVVAYREGILAADSQVTLEGIKYRSEKLYETPALLIGGAGDGDEVLAFVAFLRGGKKPRVLKNLEVLAIEKATGKIRVYANSITFDYADEPYMAVGHGGQYALGAMHQGATALQAVEAACRWSPSCGLPIKTMQLQSAVKRKR